MFQTNPHYTEPTAFERLVASVDPATRDQAILVLVAVAIAILALIALRGLVRTIRAARYRSRTASGKSTKPKLVFEKTRFLRKPWAMHDPANQMKAISQVGFKTVPLLNRSEFQLLPLLESITRDLCSGHRVMAQTSLGEILVPTTSTDTRLKSAAHASINSKRLDFAIFNRAGHLVLAVEYQGQGHYAPTAFMRDAVKREALRKAGVPLLEVASMFRPTEIRAEVVRILRGEDARPHPSAAATSSGVPMA